jgi:hypothetical protein
MLYVVNNGETCKDQLCQHPECWHSNIRRVREAVRQRNGIRQDQNVNKQSAERFDDKKRQVMESKLGVFYSNSYISLINRDIRWSSIYKKLVHKLCLFK